MKRTNKVINIDKIAEVLADHYQMDLNDVFVVSRKAKLVDFRQKFHYFAHKYTNLPLVKIATYKRLEHHHSTVLHSVAKVTAMIDIYDDVKDEIMCIKNKLSDHVKHIYETPEGKEIIYHIDDAYNNKNRIFELVNKIKNRHTKEELLTLLELEL